MNLSHLRTMLWLRWRLTRNQWRRSGGVNAALTLIFVLAGLALAVVGSVAGIAFGMLVLAPGPPRLTMVAFDLLVITFLGMWMVGLVTELQQSQFLDLGRFLHLPVALRDVFLLNYLASLLSFSMATILPLMFGLSLGLALGRGPAMLLLLPLVLSFFFMVTAWSHWLRGWMAALMVNKRRRQAVIMGISLVLVVVSQLPNLAMNVWSRGDQNRPARTAEQVARQRDLLAQREKRVEVLFAAAHGIVPLLWLPNGARGMAEGRVGPALW
ncbi:MAG: hypothetical protein ACYC6Y_05300, partial [Thermoguttaceae bacterium]